MSNFGHAMQYQALRFEACLFFFFFNDTATTEIYTLSLHDALPISVGAANHIEIVLDDNDGVSQIGEPVKHVEQLDRKSTRLNSSHSQISYAVFCLKKKKNSVKSDRSSTETGAIFSHRAELASYVNT